jgi:hypothetical protein
MSGLHGVNHRSLCQAMTAGRATFCKLSRVRRFYPRVFEDIWGCQDVSRKVELAGARQFGKQRWGQGARDQWRPGRGGTWSFARALPNLDMSHCACQHIQGARGEFYPRKQQQAWARPVVWSAHPARTGTRGKWHRCSQQAERFAICMVTDNLLRERCGACCRHCTIGWCHRRARNVSRGCLLAKAAMSCHVRQEVNFQSRASLKAGPRCAVLRWSRGCPLDGKCP